MASPTKVRASVEVNKALYRDSVQFLVKYMNAIKVLADGSDFSDLSAEVEAAAKGVVESMKPHEAAGAVNPQLRQFMQLQSSRSAELDALLGMDAPAAEPAPAAEAPAAPAQPANPSSRKASTASAAAPKAPGSSNSSPRRKSSAAAPRGSVAGSLEELFNTFCAFGGGNNAKAEMDNAKFAKFCKDTKLVDKKFTATDCDLIFSKIKVKGERKIQFSVFKEKALPEIAGKKGCSVEELEAKIMGAGGPTSSGTKADAVKFHDDKDQYTGVYKAGGPTNVDLGTSDLSQITNRKDADVRGVEK